MRALPQGDSCGALALVSALAFFACARKEVKAPPAQSTAAAVIAQPSESQAGPLAAGGTYSEGPLTVGDGWIRRTFVSGSSSIEVTLASKEMKSDEYESWYQMARLYLPARMPILDASGFFTCGGDGGVPPCALHGQTRAGLHIEATGNQSASRADIEDLLATLNWK